jgi:hypothetical protein
MDDKEHLVLITIVPRQVSKNNHSEYVFYTDGTYTKKRPNGVVEDRQWKIVDNTLYWYCPPISKEWETWGDNHQWYTLVEAEIAIRKILTD